jgi:hypothetical protein
MTKNNMNSWAFAAVLALFVACASLGASEVDESIKASFDKTDDIKMLLAGGAASAEADMIAPRDPGFLATDTIDVLASGSGIASGGMATFPETIVPETPIETPEPGPGWMDLPIKPTDMPGEQPREEPLEKSRDALPQNMEIQD